MQIYRKSIAILITALIGITASQTTLAKQRLANPNWIKVANNGDVIPGGNGELYNSYNQPSVNANGVVVFRARSSGNSGGNGPVHGIYLFDPMSGSVSVVTQRGATVPEPNNTLYNGFLSAFEEFPSIPRIDSQSNLIATRGQAPPVWTYLLDGLETRVGTAGLYANPGGSLVTVASLLGAVVEADQVTLSFPQYSVPDAPNGTRFDQFPGSPAVSDNRYIVFKGNYTDPADGFGKTGVYYRDLVPPLFGSNASPTVLIANSNTVIPNQPLPGTVLFGSTAPPTAENGMVFFVGYDIEEAPTLGGIYRAPLSDTPALEVLVGVGDPVPSEAPGTTFNSFGEALSVSNDGRYVAFWGNWGSQTFTRLLLCPEDGNAALIAFCLQEYPTGFLATIPVNQGVFVHDTQTGRTYPVAKTRREDITDFLFWVFSGRPPGTGGGDEPPDDLEPARWRSSAFVALSADPNRVIQTAFKAERNATNGIYLREGLSVYTTLNTMAEVGSTPGDLFDDATPSNSLITAVGIEREGFRSGTLVLTTAMEWPDPLDPLNTLSWAGIYSGAVEEDFLFQDGFE